MYWNILSGHNKMRITRLDIFISVGEDPRFYKRWG